jgi:hypothetical protein
LSHGLHVLLKIFCGGSQIYQYLFITSRYFGQTILDFRHLWR